jgi:ribosomal protein S18 acetylase RimI-like enzyme
MTHSSVRVRAATEVDLEAIVELSSMLFHEDGGQRDPWMKVDWPKQEGAEYYLGHIRGEDSACLLAEAGVSAVGFLTGYLREWSSLRPVELAELASMFVLPAYRGRGIGQVLVDEFVAWCRDRGVERISVTAFSTNDGALRFYRRLGFEPRQVTLEWGIDT